MRCSNTHRSPVLKLSIVIALAVMVSGCQDGGTDLGKNGAVKTSASSETFSGALGNNADLSTSAKLIDSAQLGTAIDGEGSYTVFLPTNKAWESLDTAERQTIESEESRPQLIAVLRQHIAPGYVLAADLERGLSKKDGSVTLSTMGAMPITLHRDGKTIMLGQGNDVPRIVGFPIVAGNDVIYRIDRLIPPPS